MKSLLAACALALCAGTAAAQNTGAYLGFDVAYSHAGINRSDNDATAYGGYAGVFATPALAFELGYRDLGDFGGLTANAISAAGLWLLPANDRAALYIKVGIAHTEAEAGPVTATRTAALVGIGFQYDLARALFSRLSWERYPRVGGSSTGEGNIDVFALGAGVRF
jgi:opacity protein-like surface antigen